MEIKFTEGCMCYNLEIEHKNAEDISLEELKEVAHRLPKEVIDGKSEEMQRSYYQNFIIDFVCCYGNYKHSHTCDQCGDSVGDYTINLK